MTSYPDILIRESYAAVSKDNNHNIYRRHGNVLRAKENIYKHQCKKNLKRKLKKYKLRPDGREDQDIVDVSDTLVSSLYIRSPNKVKDSVELETDKFRPKNYLFRMVRRKQTTLKPAKTLKSVDKIQKHEENKVICVSPPTEDKKQTNAFELLMESRNKSIGTNSPGKEKPNNEVETEKFIEKKAIKAKRNLILLKMAEVKGSLKKKEIEDEHDKYIQNKMDKRAEKLKSMILHKEPTPVTSDIDKKKHKERCLLDSINRENNGKVLEKSINKLQLVNIFDEIVDKQTSQEKKLITKEDEDFLKKLSPSIRKKESMLSYFKKIEIDPEDSQAENENTEIIKIKFGLKPKKSRHKKKLSLKRDSDNVDKSKNAATIAKDLDDNIVELNEELILTTNTETETTKEGRKRKREMKESTPCRESPIDNNCNSDEKRPRRCVRRPIKYNNDAVLLSSDEELHIITPKKKKQSEGKEKIRSNTSGEMLIIKDDKDITTQSKIKDIQNNDMISKKERKSTKGSNHTKPVKLAPIFSKPELGVALEAKLKFLQSGVPEQLKKLAAKQKSCNTFSNYFPTVVHVQQLFITTAVSPDLNLSEEICLADLHFANLDAFDDRILDMSTSQNAISLHSNNKVNTQTVLQTLKDAYPRFPVYRTYKMLRSKKKGEFNDNNIFTKLDNSVEIFNCSIDMQNDNPDQLTWSDKYKALSGDEVIGNFDSIKELKKWLVTWTENDSRCKVSNGNDSNSSDFYHSEPDSSDSMKSNNNLLVLSGPVGCGKTSSVYAVATELCMKVIEVNASSKRNGKIMLQELQEATQSHKVNRGTGCSENSQKPPEVTEVLPDLKVKKRGRPKKVKHMKSKKLVKEKSEITKGLSISQESTRTVMSVILIDDADIVFDQDDGFCSAVTQLVQCSKRPVILVTGSLTLPHLHKFLQCSKVLRMQPLLPRMLGTWLDLMCLADSGLCWPGIGAKFLNFFKGDMRKTINCLQFYVCSQEQVLSAANTQQNSQNSDVKINTDDENSCMSWADRDTIDDRNVNDVCETELYVWNSFLNEHSHLKHIKCSLNMFNVWLSIPKLLDINGRNAKDLNTKQASLEFISNTLDSISVCDYLNHKRPETEALLTSQPWYDAESDSVSEVENIDQYNRNYKTTRDLCSQLLIGSITTAQENMGLENKYELDFPAMSAKR